MYICWLQHILMRLAPQLTVPTFLERYVMILQESIVSLSTSLASSLAKSGLISGPANWTFPPQKCEIWRTQTGNYWTKSPLCQEPKRNTQQLLVQPEVAHSHILGLVSLTQPVMLNSTSVYFK